MSDKFMFSYVSFILTAWANGTDGYWFLLFCVWMNQWTVPKPLDRQVAAVLEEDFEGRCNKLNLVQRILECSFLKNDIVGPFFNRFHICNLVRRNCAIYVVWFCTWTVKYKYVVHKYVHKYMKLDKHLFINFSHLWPILFIVNLLFAVLSFLRLSEDKKIFLH